MKHSWVGDLLAAARSKKQTIYGFWQDEPKESFVLNAAALRAKLQFTRCPPPDDDFGQTKPKSERF
jgi:hypothetical protein